MPRVIITIPEQNAQPYRFQLDRKVVKLGRASENEIVIDCGSVSGKHAEMERVDGGYVLTDLGSTNGIKHDGVRQQKISLVSGMTAMLGDVSFDFSLSEEELEILSNEESVDKTPSAREPEAQLPSAAVEDLPRPERESARKPKRKVIEEEPADSGSGFGMAILFFALAAAAFYAGISIRHEKETGESLLKAIVNKEEIQKEAPMSEEPKGVEAAE